jgi:hypothetical protein
MTFNNEKLLAVGLGLVLGTGLVVLVIGLASFIGGW